MSSDTYDWSGREKYSPNTITCACGQMFRSHDRFGADIGIVSQRPCPKCGATTGHRKTSSDPESMTIRGGKT